VHDYQQLGEEVRMRAGLMFVLILGPGLMAFAPAPQAPAPTPSCQVQSVTSEGQIGGQTGCIINAGHNDPQREKLEGSMVAYLTDLNRAWEIARTRSVYTVLYDSRDRNIVRDSSEPVTYIIYAASAEDIEDLLPESTPTCHVSEEIVAAGMRVSIALQGDHILRERLLQANDPVLRAICKGLSQVRQSAGAVPLTTYQSLLRGDDEVVAIQLTPDQIGGVSFEERLLRLYWTGATTGLQLPREGQATTLPDGSPIPGNAADTFVKTGEFNTPVNPTLFDVPRKGEGYTQKAYRVFGAPLKSMDSEWQSFLQSSQILINGKAKPVQTGSGYPELAARSSIPDLETNLARDSAEVAEISQGAICLGIVFAVDHGYASVESVPQYRRCAVSVLPPKFERSR
jgi:hypothetical protein